MNSMRRRAILGLGLLLMAASPVLADNAMSVTVAAALNGTSNGLQIDIDNTASNAVYVQSDEPNAETGMRVVWRMKIDQLNAPQTGPGRNFRFMNFVDSDDTLNPHKVFFLQRQASGNWRLAVWTRDTSASSYVFAGGHFVATNASANDIQMECEWTKDPTAGATGDGTLTCTRLAPVCGNPNCTFTVSTLNDDLRQTDSVQWGFFDFDGFPGAASSGVMKFDEYESYRQ
jgi:hypothetical protein